MFRLFRRQSNEPLVELPEPFSRLRAAIAAASAGEPIHFDDEEQAAIRWATPSLGDDVVFKDQRDADTFQRTFAAQGLGSLAERQMERGDLSGAASSCVKALVLWIDDYDAWLILGRVHASAGDFTRAGRLLREAENAASRAHLRKDGPLIKPKFDALHAQIKARQTGIISDQS